MKKNFLIIMLITVPAAFLIAGLFMFQKSPVSVSPKSRESIGVGFVSGDAADARRYQALLDYLTKNSSDSWQLVPIKDYGSLISEMENGRIKAGFVGAAAAYRMVKEQIASPIARGEKDGVADFYAEIITRKDSDITSTVGLVGKTFAYVDPYTLAGFFYPQSLIKGMGYDPDNFFKTASFVGTYEEAISAVLDKRFDGGATKDITLAEMAKTNPAVEKDLQVIEKNGPYPEQVFVISTELNMSEIGELRGILSAMTGTDEGKSALAAYGADRFVATSAADLDKVKNIVSF